MRYFMTKKVRSRFAPSPTGYMHIGNLRTALYEYLVAKSNDGDFILRIEDTDQTRYVEGAINVIFETLKTVGIIHNEGPDIGGEYGPYTQSERLDIYKEYSDKLVDLKGAHYCFCSEEDILLQKEWGEKNKRPFKFNDPCKNISTETARERIRNGEKYTVRQTIPLTGKTSFFDEIYGEITVDNKTLDESILLKSDGFPTYNFANVIDDHLMQITHVVRGNEYLSSTPKYNLIYNCFGWEIPKYIHLPPIMKDAHDKLSKRNGDASFQDLVEKGYLPEAIINYIALLGWNPKSEQEIYSIQDLIKKFSIQGLNKSPAIFDIEKLSWMNGVYIRKLTLEDFYERALPYYKKCISSSINFLELSKIIQPRIEKFSDIYEATDFIDTLPDYNTDLYINKKMKTDINISLKSLESAYNSLLNFNKDFSMENIHNMLMELPIKLEAKTGQVLWPVRIALTGKQFTPGGAGEAMFILGKEESLKRLMIGIKKLNA